MSGFGVHFNAQHRRWQYAKGCPKHLRSFFCGRVFGSKGEPFERRYLDSAPREDTAAAKRIAIVESEPYAKRDAAVIAQLEAMTADERQYVLEHGGWQGLKRHADAQMLQVETSNQIAAIANGINRRAPLPNPSLILPRPRSTPPPDDFRRRGGDGMTYAPIRDTGKCPIAFTDFGGIPCVVLPSEPSNWAETRADLQDWASEMGAKAAAQHAQAQAILLKAEPAGEFSFDGLLAVYVKRKGDKWRGKDADKSRHQDGLSRTVRLLRVVLGNVDYRDVDARKAAEFRDALEAMGKSYDWRYRQLQHAHRMYAAAVNLRTIDANPFANLTPHGEAADDDKIRRGGFSPAQLRAILAKAKDIKFGDERHRDVMHALEGVACLGLAPNEILLIQRGDVGVDPETGVKFLDITDKDCVTKKRHELKSLKNRESRPRLLPLHPKLIEFGFFDFAYTADKSKKKEFVFAAFPWNKHKYRRGWFDQNLVPMLLKEMEHVGITLQQRDGKTVAVNARGEMLTFYSMRHQFHALLDNSDISRKRQLVLTGHASQEDHDKYAHGANLLKLYKDVAKLDPLADVGLDEQVD